MVSPFERSAMETYPSKTAWDAVATEILGSMLERWHLTDAHVFPATAAAVVAAVRRRDGSPAVLKVGFPHEEGVWEAALLDALPDDLGPEVLDQDAWTWAMLLERLTPGTTLLDAGYPAVEAVAIGAELQRRLAATPPPTGVPALGDQYRPFVGRLASEAAVRLLGDGGFPEGAALSTIEEFEWLFSSASRQALLHGDLNPGNILRHGDGWRIIDPKPAVGDPAFDTFSLVRDLMTDTGSRAELTELADAATRVAGVDGERALRWIRVRATLSAFWNLEDGLTDAGRRDTALARSAGDLLGLEPPR